METVEFSVREGSIAGLKVITVKEVSDERGIVREVFRRSAYAAAGIDLDRFVQINVTETRAGAVRGMHAEWMTKLTTVAAGEAFGVYVDLRADSATAGEVDTVTLRPGVEVLVPPGVANGFQSLSNPSAYLYCFDQEWYPGMPGVACTPLDPAIFPHWPMHFEHDDPAFLSAKDRMAPTLDAVRASFDADDAEGDES